MFLIYVSMRVITFNHSGSPTFKIFKIKIFANVFYRWAKLLQIVQQKKKCKILGCLLQETDRHYRAFARSNIKNEKLDKRKRELKMVIINNEQLFPPKIEMKERKEGQSILDGCITIRKYGNIKKLDSKKGMGVEQISYLVPLMKKNC